MNRRILAWRWPLTPLRVAATLASIVFISLTVWFVQLPSKVDVEPTVVAQATASPSATVLHVNPSATIVPTPVPTPQVPTLPTPPATQQEQINVEGPLLRRVPYEAWFIAQLHFPPTEQYRAVRTSWCESQWTNTAVGAAGEIGWFQIHPLWFTDNYYGDGKPADINVLKIIDSWFPGASATLETRILALEWPHTNAQVARYIFDINESWTPWTTRFGCNGWQG